MICEKFVISNKFNQGNFQKTNAGSKSQDICQELTVTSGHAKAYFTEILRIRQNTITVGRYMQVALVRQNGHHTVTTVLLRKYHKWTVQNRLRLVETYR